MMRDPSLSQVTLTQSVSTPLNLTSEFPSGRFEALLKSRPKKPLRTQNAIVTAILEACRTPCVEHWILVKARIGYSTFQAHMDELISNGMLEMTRDGNKTLYRLNAKGLGLLNTLTA